MDQTTEPIVIALGGNAISPEGEKGNITQQFARTRQTAVHLAKLIVSEYLPVITHGNGPQVGNVIRRVELAAMEIYRLPLDICVADTQAGMGYMIAQCINNILRKQNFKKTVSAIVTSVRVDENDPAFKNPTKPIGKWYSKTEMTQMNLENKWEMLEDPVKGYRRIVASPKPVEIIEIDLIRNLINNQQIIITAGGGGIPVINQPGQGLIGCEVVIDKDRTSSLLAREINAPKLVIVTSVDQVYANFGKPDQKILRKLNAQQAQQYLQDGQFPAGSMGPKIEAAIEFVKLSTHPDAEVIICSMDNILNALKGNAGTSITLN